MEKKEKFSDEIIKCSKELYNNIYRHNKGDIPLYFLEQINIYYTEWVSKDTDLTFYEFCKSKYNTETEIVSEVLDVNGILNKYINLTTSKNQILNMNYKDCVVRFSIRGMVGVTVDIETITKKVQDLLLNELNKEIKKINLSEISEKLSALSLEK